jgi:hypothetical protein
VCKAPSAAARAVNFLFLLCGAQTMGTSRLAKESLGFGVGNKQVRKYSTTPTDQLRGLVMRQLSS